MQQLPLRIELPTPHSITVYFPINTFKLMLTTSKAINRLYSGLGAEAEIHTTDIIGMLIVSGNKKQSVVEAAILIANKTARLKPQT